VTTESNILRQGNYVVADLGDDSDNPRPEECPYCKTNNLGLNTCKHVVFYYDATNGDFLYMADGFRSLALKRIKEHPEMSEYDHDEEELAEFNDDDWIEEMMPSPRSDDFRRLLPEIDIYEYCDTDNRTYYMGGIYGYLPEDAQSSLFAA